MSTIDSTRQARQPSGAAASTGGQFAPKKNPPPEDPLAESATGTFLYPPADLRLIDDYIAFFESATISDQVLSNATYAYQAWRRKAMLAHIRHLEGIFRDNPSKELVKAIQNAGVNAHQVLENHVAPHRPQWIAEAEAMYPIHGLPRAQLRNILRAHQICVHRGMLPEADEQKAEDHPILHEGTYVRAGDLAAHYNTQQWARDALTESDFATAETMNRVANLIAEQSGITDYDQFRA